MLLSETFPVKLLQIIVLDVSFKKVLARILLTWSWSLIRPRHKHSFVYCSPLNFLLNASSTFLDESRENSKYEKENKQKSS